MQTTHIAATPARGLIDKARRLVEDIARPWLVSFALRVALAVPFWKSGLLKWDGFLQLKDTAIYLFADEFKLHLPGGPYPFPRPPWSRLRRAAAKCCCRCCWCWAWARAWPPLGLLAMTCVIELTVPEGWPVHLTWAAMALAIAASGPGRLSVDHWLGERSPRP